MGPDRSTGEPATFLAIARRGLWLLAGSALLSACQGGALRPQGRGAATIAGLWWIMLLAGAAVYALVLAVLALALVRRRRRRGQLSRTDRRFIVWGGIVLPAVVLGPLLGVMIATIVAVPAGEGTHEVQVTGHQFWWEVRYPEGIVSANELHVPVGEQVRVRLATDDVIHSFWVPELAGKRDLVPGRENVVVLEATEPGVYRGQCAEFCGIQHANMAFYVIAHEPGEYERWLAEAAEPAPEPQTAAQRRGREEFFNAGCAACHAVAGTPADGDVGPDLTHFASRRTIGAGAAENSRGNLGGWVVDAQTLKPGSLMPAQDVDPQRLPDLLDYLETLE